MKKLPKGKGRLINLQALPYSVWTKLSQSQGKSFLLSAGIISNCLPCWRDGPWARTKAHPSWCSVLWSVIMTLNNMSDAQDWPTWLFFLKGKGILIRSSLKQQWVRKVWSLAPSILGIITAITTLRVTSCETIKDVTKSKEWLFEKWLFGKLIMSPFWTSVKSEDIGHIH